MSNERAVQIATQLHLLGVSHAGVVELLSQYPLEEIEKQLEYLPYRKAKRPEAMIIEAVRNRYTPPKEFYYAKTQASHPAPQPLVDQSAEYCAGQIPADSEGHGAASAPDLDSLDERLEPGGQSIDLVLPTTDQTNR